MKEDKNSPGDFKFGPLKNRDLVHLRYFDDSTSVFVSRSSEEHLKLFYDVTTRTFQDNSKFQQLIFMRLLSMLNTFIIFISKFSYIFCFVGFYT